MKAHSLRAVAIGIAVASIAALSSVDSIAAAKDEARAAAHRPQLITTVVRFQLPAGTSREAANALYEGSVATYQKVPGLIRKYYLYSQQDSIGGGVYLWESREAAERLYTSEWRKSMAQRLGAEPEVLYFETPVVIDNHTQEVSVN